LRKDWTSPIYAFFKPLPDIKYEKEWWYHAFICTQPGCKHQVYHYLDKTDATSTGNLHKHISHCWGDDVLKRAMQMSSAVAVWEDIVKSLTESGTLESAFMKKGKGKQTYLTLGHSKTETRCMIRTMILTCRC
ncbi:hypothetical protein PISMIDRAFT_105865, partial [Pisolithus microcarpus 441]